MKIKTNTGALELLRPNFERSKEMVGVVRIIETLLGYCEELIGPTTYQIYSTLKALISGLGCELNRLVSIEGQCFGADQSGL